LFVPYMLVLSDHASVVMILYKIINK